MGALSPRRKLLPGEGLIKLAKTGQQAVFEDLQFSYPLKLIVPARHFKDGLQCVYMISYGGGLVAGDRVRIDVEVGEDTALVMLTQGASSFCTAYDCPRRAGLLTRPCAGSTKVFRTRPGRFPTATLLPNGTAPTTTQQLLNITIAPRATLILLPSPVTCFSLANYAQRQSFVLSPDSNLVLLDWYTSGRMSMSISATGEATPSGEEWAFTRYRSTNQVILSNRRIIHDILDLDSTKPPSSSDTTTSSPPSPNTTSASYLPRVAPYSCYATLVLYGPRLGPMLAHLEATFARIVQYKQTNPYSLVWSFSPLEKGQGGIARCAGATTEMVREWVQEVLKEGGIEELVGKDLWTNTFS